MAHELLVILGPTASGKTELACHLAYQLNGEIISADSRQVYRGMDIGTGKDIEEYEVNGQAIPYHLIDIKPAGYKYNIAEFQTDFIQSYHKISDRNKLPILCGGSGLYLETALHGNSYLGIPTDENLWQELKAVSELVLENEYQNIAPNIKADLNALTPSRKIRAIEINNFLINNPNWKPVQIPKMKPLIIGLDIDRNSRRTKITQRLSDRLNSGLIEEVELLIKKGIAHENLSYYGLEYKWVSLYLRKELSKKELFEGLNTAIHQFSKRQMTWFRRMEKKGFDIKWIAANLSLEEKVKQVKTNWID